MRFLRTLFMLAALGAMPSVAFSSEAQPKPPADFVPVENAPPGEQIPAMPLLGTAYGFIWVGVFGYVWSLARRLRKVEAEIAELEAKRR
jgi:CcmD family protein